jgi:hypothetical protein
MVQEISTVQLIFQLLPLILLIAVAGIVVYAVRRRSRREETPEIGITPGIKGWLVLLALGLVLAPIRLLLDVISYYATPGMADVFARFPFMMRSEAFLNVSLFTAGCVTIYHLARKHRAFRTAFYVQYGLSVAAFPLITAISHASLASETGGFAVFGDDDMVGLTRWLFMTVIGGVWAAYVAKSRRVAVTFVN